MGGSSPGLARVRPSGWRRWGVPARCLERCFYTALRRVVLRVLRASDATVVIRTDTQSHIQDIVPARRYERPLVNIRTLISTGVVAATLVLAGPAASYAAITPEPTPTKPAAVDTTDTAVLNQLHELEGKQSTAEIAKVSASLHSLNVSTSTLSDIGHLFDYSNEMTARPRLAQREPRSLQPEQLGQLSVSTPAVPQRVHAWVLWEDGVEELMDAQALAWTRRAVLVRFGAPPHQHEVWVWAGAVDRG